ncbi:hypothetical protein Tco_0117216 [Tanacetum coccineum]
MVGCRRGSDDVRRLSSVWRCGGGDIGEAEWWWRGIYGGAWRKGGGGGDIGGGDDRGGRWRRVMLVMVVVRMMDPVVLGVAETVMTM